ncbi:MAG: hypothetical protein R2711_02680 [Acidimicrobiales bacterium]
MAVLLTGGWDTVDQRFEGTGPLAPTDPGYRRRIAEGYADVTRRLVDAGVDRVLWLAEPTSDPFWNPVPSPQEEPERHLALHREMQALAAATPDEVAVADLGGWMAAAGWLDDHECDDRRPPHRRGRGGARDPVAGPGGARGRAQRALSTSITTLPMLWFVSR